MTSRTPHEEKALAWYCQQTGLMPQLSTHPTYYFRDREGNETHREIEHIVADFKREKLANRKGKQSRLS